MALVSKPCRGAGLVQIKQKQVFLYPELAAQAQTPQHDSEQGAKEKLLELLNHPRLLPCAQTAQPGGGRVN